MLGSLASPSSSLPSPGGAVWGSGLSCSYFSLCPKPHSPVSGADQKLPLDGRAGELHEPEIWLGKQSLKNTQSLSFPVTTAESLQRK